jgi:hypothetical protein
VVPFADPPLILRRRIADLDLVGLRQAWVLGDKPDWAERIAEIAGNPRMRAVAQSPQHRIAKDLGNLLLKSGAKSLVLPRLNAVHTCRRYLAITRELPRYATSSVDARSVAFALVRGCRGSGSVRLDITLKSAGRRRPQCRRARPYPSAAPRRCRYTIRPRYTRSARDRRGVPDRPCRQRKLLPLPAGCSRQRRACEAHQQAAEYHRAGIPDPSPASLPVTATVGVAPRSRAPHAAVSGFRIAENRRGSGVSAIRRSEILSTARRVR